MSDPLAQFRRKPVGGARQTTAEGESDEYVAFGAKDRCERLRIRRGMAPTRSPGYYYLLDIAYDGQFGLNFVLTYTFMMVLVRGKNLQKIVMALETGTADFIQQYDHDRWPAPKDSAAPFIESIEVVMSEKDEVMAEAEKIASKGKPH